MTAPLTVSSRRHFLAASLAVPLTASFAVPLLAGGDTASSPQPLHPVRLGCPVFFSEDDPQAWAQAARAQRNRAVYAPNVALSDKDRIRAIVKATDENDLVIAEVGRWCNLMDANTATREANLQSVTDGLALADELNARCCVDIAGSYHEKIWFAPHPKNVSEEFFDRAVENARKIIDAVKPKRSALAYEMVGWSIPDSVEGYQRLLKAVDRPQFGVHVDICNLVNTPAKFWDTSSLIRHIFTTLGDRIVACHAKDIRWIPEMNIHFQECVIGEGTVDWGTFLRHLSALDRDVPLMIEHMASQEEYEKSRQRLFAVGSEVGVVFDHI